MVQTVDVIAIFDKMIREPKPVRFKIYDRGHWKSVNVERILNIEWMRLDGKVQINTEDTSAGIFNGPIGNSGQKLS